jgi:2'-5' RNA ligase
MHTVFGGRAVPAENIHLTLAFLGSVAVEHIDELRAIGASVRNSQFQLDLTKTGCWKRSAVGWVAPDHVPAPLETLELELRNRLAAAGFPPVDDKPFSPHVTLLRKAKCTAKPESPNTPLVWSVDRFVLVRSETLKTGPVYSRIEEWFMHKKAGR